MFKQIITLILTTLVIIYAQNPTTLQNSLITTTEEAEIKLAPIHISEALPVVLFEVVHNEMTSTSTSTSTSTLTYDLHLPLNIIHAVTEGRKMVNGTTFFRMDSQEQIFFCPKENSDGTCLVPQKFDDSKQLKCSKQPIPIAKEIWRMKCGVDQKSTIHYMIYKICDSKPPYRYKTKEIALYSVCYNKINNKVSYINHYIRSPKLLKSKLLHREHNLSYSFPESELRLANYYDIENSLDSESDPFVTANKPLYRVQNLVPSEDMAFGSWKIAAYEVVNADFQHREIFPFWKEINEKVTSNAILMHDNDSDLWHNVFTGVFDYYTTSESTSESIVEKQIYNVWVKMIFLQKQGRDLQGVVILMNNFIVLPNEYLIPKVFQESIEFYCLKDLCADDIKNRVENIGGRMRCCPTTKEIGDLFGLTTNPNLPVLQIPDLINIQD